MVTHRTRKQGVLFLSHSTVLCATSDYRPHITEAERIALRLTEGGCITHALEAKAARKAAINARLRPRRFSWEVGQ